MASCDVLIVGGGPAGSTCAWRLRQAGVDVIVADASTFPRDKVCAGWITPQAVTALHLDTEAYASGRTLQPFTGFRVGLIGGEATRVGYERPVSFGIRRCEFDHYLLQRAGARLMLGVPIASLRRDARGVDRQRRDPGAAAGWRRRFGMSRGADHERSRAQPSPSSSHARRRRGSAPPSSRRSRSNRTSRSCSSAAICKATAGACAKASI